MNTKLRILIVIGSLLLAGLIIATRHWPGSADVGTVDAATESPELMGVESTGNSTQAAGSQATVSGIPRLVDLGAKSCIPCKMMAPILEEMKTSYSGKLQVDFIDVWVNPKAGEKYRIQMIPTQIFYGADGRELSRHVGFISKEDILARFKSHGIELPDLQPNQGQR